MRTSKFNIPGLVTILVLLAGWEVLVRSGAAKFDYLPAPSGILLASGSLIVSGELFSQALHTVESILIGWTSRCGDRHWARSGTWPFTIAAPLVAGVV